MPLETATYIHDLVSTNPVGTDQMSQGDDHIRLLKSVLQAQFPNFTAAALSSTNTALDAVVTAVATNGVTILGDAGAHFKTNATDGILNPSSGHVQVAAANTVSAEFTSTGVTVPGTLGVTGATTHTGAVSGPGLTPIGASQVWWSDTLPSGFGTWGFCNGQSLDRTTYAALFAILGTTYGAADGSHFNVPDLRDNVPVGKGNMGGTGAVSRITNFTSTSLANMFGTCTHTITTGQAPSGLITLNFSDPTHGHGVGIANAAGGFSNNHSTVNGTSGFAGSDASVVAAASTGITASLNDNGGNQAHNNVQPSLVCNWIIRLL